MKTFAALIRRYVLATAAIVLATAAIVLLVGGLLVGQIFMWGSSPTRWMQRATGSAPWLMP